MEDGSGDEASDGEGADADQAKKREQSAEPKQTATSPKSGKEAAKSPKSTQKTMKKKASEK